MKIPCPFMFADHSVDISSDFEELDSDYSPDPTDMQEVLVSSQAQAKLVKFIFIP